MELPVLLIEFEGVLVETAPHRAAAWRTALAAEGVNCSAEELAAVVGFPVEEGVRRLRRGAALAEDETAVELATLRAERAFAERAGKGLALQPGVIEALERLGTRTRLALVTRASRREVEFVLGLAGLDGLFRPIITKEDVAAAKPSATPWQQALARVGDLFPGQKLKALAVEDSLSGIRSARAAGIPCIAVGPLPAHELLEAAGWVPSLSELTSERVRHLLGLSASERR